MYNSWVQPDDSLFGRTMDLKIKE